MKTSAKTSVQIIGAGISGLLCAYYAVGKGYDVDVYETAPEAGGKLQTLKSQHGLMETAANAILADLEVENVAATIGVKLIAKNSQAKKRYIYVMGSIRRWPLGLADSLRVLRFVCLWALGASSIKPQAGETLKTWSDRVMSSAVTEMLLGPACQGIFGVDAGPLSATLIFNYFFAKAPRAHGELRGSVAPEGGMGEWTKGIVKYLRSKNVRFHFSQAVKPDPSKIVIIATDLKNAVQILGKQNDERAKIFSTVPFVDLVSLNVFFASRPKLQSPGFGVLFSRQENLEPLGVLFNSDIFANRSNGQHSETWIFGSQKAGYANRSENEFVADILAVRQKLWKSSDALLEIKVNRWPEAIPLYGVELEQALQKLKPMAHNGPHLVGNYLGELGLNRLFHRAKSLLETIDNGMIEK